MLTLPCGDFHKLTFQLVTNCFIHFLFYSFNYMYFISYILFSNALEESSCSSSICKHKSINSSVVTYQSFKTYTNRRLNIMAPIKTTNSSGKLQCVSSCQNVSDCTSVNFNYRLPKDNCELLSENSYQNLTNLVQLSGWSHYTTYVSLYFFILLTFYWIFLLLIFL